MATARPIVSVITANYNGARHLAAAARSVLDQTLTDLELIVVDDASTDDSLRVLAAEVAGDPRVRVLRHRRNKGPAAARNRALAQARGCWIAVFDSDDLMAPDRLEALVGRAEAEWADVVVDNLIVFSDESEDPWKLFLNGAAWSQPRNIGLEDYIASSRLYSSRPGPGYLKPLICARTLARTGIRYRETLRVGEDYDLIVRLLAQGAKLHLEPRPLYRYRTHGGAFPEMMRREDVEALLAADHDFERAYPHQPAGVRQALQARRRSLQAALAYDGVMTRLKAHDVGGGIRSGLREPAIWPLLALPVRARLRQLAARLHPA